jgi:hypothetical protein
MAIGISYELGLDLLVSVKLRECIGILGKSDHMRLGDRPTVQGAGSLLLDDLGQTAEKRNRTITNRGIKARKSCSTYSAQNACLPESHQIVNHSRCGPRVAKPESSPANRYPRLLFPDGIKANRTILRREEEEGSL